MIPLDESTDAFAQDGVVSYYARPVSGQLCRGQPVCAESDPHEIHRLDGLSFEPAPRLESR
jgi:hypothetical protein